jgi:hypothetical protein
VSLLLLVELGAFFGAARALAIALPTTSEKIKKRLLQSEKSSSGVCYRPI